ncbi:hypothetical protein BCR44DRAFT_1439868 [Catenaria anguillulae PL171]|uniref:Uncharacterized protein n=1 Tax=Catenaria anguillulae PL171 TaxID=765915 RepID=A0A1Y2HDC7_9FUNG|nr:hypothetical protein BCR44DRAFT_1439868 [Catenaria anguillulae PL171]
MSSSSTGSAFVLFESCASSPSPPSAAFKFVVDLPGSSCVAVATGLTANCRSISVPICHDFKCARLAFSSRCARSAASKSSILCRSSAPRSSSWR